MHIECGRISSKCNWPFRGSAMLMCVLFVPLCGIENLQRCIFHDGQRFSREDCGFSTELRKHRAQRRKYKRISFPYSISRADVSFSPLSGSSRRSAKLSSMSLRVSNLSWLVLGRMKEKSSGHRCLNHNSTRSRCWCKEQDVAYILWVTFDPKRSFRAAKLALAWPSNSDAWAISFLDSLGSGSCICMM